MKFSSYETILVPTGSTQTRKLILEESCVLFLKLVIKNALHAFHKLGVYGSNRLQSMLKD